MSRYPRILHDAIEHYGSEHQQQKCIEEMAELTTALLHYRDKKATKEEVITEVADVINTIGQMAIIFGEDDVNAEVTSKLYRLQQRIHNEKGATK